MSASQSPAFPRSDVVRNGVVHEWAEMGLTKRELFAAMAMQGSLGGEPGSHLEPRRLAIESVRHADALIAELAKEPAL